MDECIKHHGVIGMRWGVRRYQPYPKNHTGGKEIGEAAKKKTNVKEKLGGLASGAVVGSASFAVSQKIFRPLAGIAVSKLAPDATPEEHKAMSNGLAALGSLTVSAVATHHATKAGEKAVRRYLETKKESDTNDRKT